MDIIYSVLKVSESRALKTHLVYKANINSKLAKRYINALIETDLMTVKQDKDNPTYYEPTDKGKAFLRSYDTIKQMFET